MEFRWVEWEREPPSLNVSRTRLESRGKWTADAEHRQWLERRSRRARGMVAVVEDEGEFDDLSHGAAADRRRVEGLLAESDDRCASKHGGARANHFNRLERRLAVAIDD